MGPPQWDSGFVNINQGEDMRFDHFLGGDPHKMFVNLTFQAGPCDLCQSYMDRNLATGVITRGAFWHGLDESEIWVYRGSTDVCAVQVRVRIWKY